MFINITILAVQALVAVLLFVYVNNRIKRKLQAHTLQDVPSDEVQKINFQQQVLQEKFKCIEKFAVDLYNDADTKLSLITSTNQDLSKNYEQWASVYANLKNLESSLQEKHMQFNNLFKEIEVAEQRAQLLIQERARSENVFVQLSNINSNADDLLLRLDNKIEAFNISAIEKINEFEGATSVQIEHALQMFSDNLHEHKQEEFVKIQSETSVLYASYEANTQKVSERLESEIESIRQEINEIYSEADSKMNQFQGRFRSDLSQAEKLIGNEIHKFESKGEEIVERVAQDYEIFRDKYEEKVSAVRIDLDSTISDKEARISNIKIDFKDHVAKLFDKIDMYGNEKVKLFREDLDISNNSLSTQLHHLETEVNSKIVELKQYSDGEYQSLHTRISDMASASSEAEHDTYDNINRLNTFFEEAREKLDADLSSLEAKQQQINDTVQEVKKKNEGLEQDIIQIHEDAQQAFSEELTTYIGQIKEDIAQQEDEYKNAMSVNYRTSLNKIHEHVNDLQENLVHNIDEENKKFLDDLSEYQHTLSVEVEVHKEKITKLLSDREDNVASQFVNIDSQLQAYDANLAKKLQETGDEILSSYSAKVLKYSNHFDAKVREVQNELEALKMHNEEGKETINRKYLEVVEEKVGEAKTKAEETVEKINRLYADANANQSNVLAEYLSILDMKIGEIEATVETTVENIHTLYADADANRNSEKEKYLAFVEEKAGYIRANAEAAVEGMNALYAQASDQQSDITGQYAATVVEKVEEVEARIAEAKEHIDKWQAEAENYQHNAKEQYAALVEEKVESIHAFVDSVIQSIEATKEHAADNQVELLQSHIEKIDNKTAEFDYTVEVFATKINIMQQESETNLSNIHEHYFTNITGQYAEYETKVEVLTQKIDDFHQHNVDIQINANKKYLDEIDRHTAQLEDTVANATQQIEHLHQNSEEKQQELEKDYEFLKQEAKIQKNEYQKFASELHNMSNMLAEEIQNSKELYNIFTKQYAYVQEQCEKLMQDNEELQQHLVKTDNYRSTMVATEKENKSLHEALEQHRKELKVMDAQLKDALVEHKHTIADVKKIERQVKRATMHEDLITQQVKNIDKIKEELASVYDKQQTIKEFQKDLKSWDKDHTVLTNTINALQGRTKEIEQQCTRSENNMRAWNSKLSGTNNRIDDLNNKLSSIEVINSEIDKIDSSFILNNIEEYKEMQKHFVERDSKLQETLSAADKKLQTLGTVVNGIEDSRGKGKKNGSDSLEVQRTALDLYKQGWKNEQIASLLKITVGEVALILQRSLVT